MLPAPIGADQKIITIGGEVGNRDNNLPAGLASNGIQQQDCLSGEQGTDVAPAGPDNEDIQVHKGFNKEINHHLTIEDSFLRLQNHNRDMPPCHLLIMKIRRVVLDGIFPKPLIFGSLGRARLDGNFLPLDLNGRARLGQQVIVPTGILFLAPVGTNQEIIAISLEIGDGGDIVFAGIVPNAVQQQDGLRSEPAADTSAAEADGKGIEGHEDLQEELIHGDPGHFSK